MTSKIYQVRALLGLLWLMTSCTSPVPTAGTYVWIDAPIDGLSLPIGDIVTIDGHASNIEGISQIEIWINGELFITQEDPPSRGNLAHFKHIWVPPEPGEYIVQVLAFGDDDTISPPDAVVLHISEIAIDISPSDTPTPTLVGDGITITTTPTLVATTITPTLVGDGITITPTPTSWSPTDTPTPPTNTPTPAPDTSAPQPPSPISPIGNPVLPCASWSTLNWSAVSDRSGINEYRVQLERHSGDNNWQPASGSPFGNLNATSLEVSVECGWYYRWRVRAVDGAGNVGSFSSWAYFTVTLG